MGKDERGNRLLRFLDRYAGIPASKLGAVYRRLCFTQPPDDDSSQRIGILCFGAIGDLLLVSALAHGLRGRLPTSWIEVITSESNAQALPLIPHINDSRAFSIKNPARILKYLRARPFDILIDTSQWARVGNILCNLSLARRTIGFDTAGQHRKAGYDIPVQHKNDRHEVKNFLALAKSLYPDLKGEPCLNLPPHCENQQKLVYCHMWPAPGAGRELKLWPARHWAHLINRLLAHGYKIRLTGSWKDEDETRSFIHEFFPGTHAVRSWAGKVNIPHLAREFARASAVISVNTGIMHLGALSGAPTVGLHGATNPVRWGPWGPRAIALVPRRGVYGYLNLGFEYPRGVEPAMRYLPVEDVLSALTRLGVLQETHNSKPRA